VDAHAVTGGDEDDCGEPEELDADPDLYSSSLPSELPFTLIADSCLMRAK
jgi:hypothetical protein